MLAGIGFDVRDPSTATLVRWLRHGLTPTQAAYAALAEDTGRPLVSADETLRDGGIGTRALIVYTYILCRQRRPLK